MRSAERHLSALLHVAGSIVLLLDLQLEQHAPQHERAHLAAGAPLASPAASAASASGSDAAATGSAPCHEHSEDDDGAEDECTSSAGAPGGGGAGGGGGGGGVDGASARRRARQPRPLDGLWDAPPSQRGVARVIFASHGRARSAQLPLSVSHAAETADAQDAFVRPPRLIARDGSIVVLNAMQNGSLPAALNLPASSPTFARGRGREAADAALEERSSRRPASAAAAAVAAAALGVTMTLEDVSWALLHLDPFWYSVCDAALRACGAYARACADVLQCSDDHRNLRALLCSTHAAVDVAVQRHSSTLGRALAFVANFLYFAAFPHRARVHMRPVYYAPPATAPSAASALSSPMVALPAVRVGDVADVHPSRGRAASPSSEAIQQRGRVLDVMERCFQMSDVALSQVLLAEPHTPVARDEHHVVCGQLLRRMLPRPSPGADGQAASLHAAERAFEVAAGDYAYRAVYVDEPEGADEHARPMRVHLSADSSHSSLSQLADIVADEPVSPPAHRTPDAASGAAERASELEFECALAVRCRLFVPRGVRGAGHSQHPAAAASVGPTADADGAPSSQTPTPLLPRHGSGTFGHQQYASGEHDDLEATLRTHAHHHVPLRRIGLAHHLFLIGARGPACVCACARARACVCVCVSVR
jgi:hypothetical protein